MYHIIYQVTNLENGKIYIGKHSTKHLDDGYMGSGKLIQRALKRYQLSSFKKEILYVFDTAEDMDNKEAELVTEEFTKKRDNYNLCPGGNGGFGYLNAHKDSKSWRRKGGVEAQKDYKNYFYNIYGVEHPTQVPEIRERMTASLKRAFLEGRKRNDDNFRGKTHSEKTKKVMSEKAKERLADPEKNSQYGTMWITDGSNNKKIKKDSPLPSGWKRGRTTNNRAVV